MDNLISIARIGRSLGVHLILATQKPSGVVTDQIWSNAKFHVCLKVQDEVDSKEMLKKPDAAGLKQTGRFYLQVGYDEFFVLGQSAWCGAKYYPKDELERKIDKSINFISESGLFIKSVQAATKNKVQPSGEQISAIMKVIMDVANNSGKYAKKLWLENISKDILIDDIEKKYGYFPNSYNVDAVIGEYDAPEEQVQGCVKYDYLENGNTIIYGNDGSERENLLSTLIYSTVKNHVPEEINYYVIDYGSETLRMFEKLPHFGGFVYNGEEEEYNNLFKMLKEELQKRKRLFSSYGGEYKNYIATSNDKLPIKVIILNNYDSITEDNPGLIEELPPLIRDSERYGIVFIITANAINSVHNKVVQNCKNIYTFKLKDSTDYGMAFGVRTNVVPRDIFGRGLYMSESVHEFQTARIVLEEQDLNSFINSFVEKEQELSQGRASHIPILPDIIGKQYINHSISNIHSVPVGIDKNDLEVVKMDFLYNIGNIISSNKLSNMNKFAVSLIDIMKQISKLVLVFDPLKLLDIDNRIIPNYYVDNFDTVIDSILKYMEQLKESDSNTNGVILIYGLSKFISKLEDSNKINTLMDLLKVYEKISVIIFDEPSKIKNYSFENWFNKNFSINDGIWIGRGVSDQNLFHLTTITRDMQKNYKIDMGYIINESTASLCKLIDFVSKEDSDE